MLWHNQTFQYISVLLKFYCFIDVDMPLMPEEPLQLSLTPSTPYVQAIVPPSKDKEHDTDPNVIDGNMRPNDMDERAEYAILFSTLLESNALLLEEIKALRHGQQSTTPSLPEESLTDQEQLCQNLAPQLLRDTWVTLSHKQPSLTSSSQDDGSGSRSWSEVEDIEPTAIVEVSDDSSDSSSVTSSKVDPFASPGALAVRTMWDNFSVNEYSILNDTEMKESPKRGKKEWVPKITVPQPFAMTVREANTPKQKSRSLKQAEEEQLHKAAEEEAELMKKFRASPVPASTFLPLYELVNAKNEQRQEEVKRLSKDLLKANERPFSFTRREKELKQIKARQAALLKQIEDREQKKNKFKAKPAPKHLFSPLIDERIREQEEYRKIKIQMRSEELLASSKLPGTMQLRGQNYRTRKPERAEHEEDNEYPFHPNINGTVPDYDQAYLEFQKRLAAKKRTKQTTITEPFHLRTKCISSRKQQQVIEDNHRGSQVLSDDDRWSHVAPRAKVSRKSPKHTRSKTFSSTYPAQMTQTALLRQTLAQEKAERDQYCKLKDQDEMAERKKRGKQVKKSVIEKSLSSDPTAWLEEKKKQKLQEFQ